MEPSLKTKSEGGGGGGGGGVENASFRGFVNDESL